MKKAKYDWWLSRFGRAYELFDVIRINHFHGFADVLEIPYGDETAENKQPKKGPGMDFFKALKTKYPDLKMIAEDLGTNTPEKVKLLEDTGFRYECLFTFCVFTGYGHDSTYFNP